MLTISIIQFFIDVKRIASFLYMSVPFLGYHFDSKERARGPR